MRAFTTNVGINTHPDYLGRSGPIYQNGSFSFIPIPTQRKGSPSYRKLGFKHIFSRLGMEHNLSLRVHNDPEFKTFTFGTFPESQGNVSTLKEIRKGDYILFVSSLQRNRHEQMGKQFQNWIADGRGMYFIGMFEIVGILTRESNELRTKAGRFPYKENPHFQWLVDNEENLSWIFKGSKRSMLFPIAVPIMRDDVHELFKVVPKKTKQSETAYVNSYTRSSREVFDIDYLRDLVFEYIPYADL